MKAIIHQFDPQIYPRLIWVVIGEKSASAISDRFENITDMDDTSAADTQSTYDITNKRGGVLIRFATKANAQNIQVRLPRIYTCGYGDIRLYRWTH